MVIFKRNNQNGITLIALVITIIVLLILAGMSISILLGDTGVLNKAREAKQKNEIAHVSEELKFAQNEAQILYHTNNIENSDYSKSLPYYIKKDESGNITFTNKNSDIFNNNCYGAENVILEESTLAIDSDGKITGGKNEGFISGVYQSRQSKLWYSFKINIETGEIETENGTLEDSGYKAIVGTTNRSNISVGDYVKYVPPAREPYTNHLTSAYTGYSSDQSLGQEYNIWKVLSKNDDGSLNLFPVKNLANKRTTIYFSNAVGWNNAVYILHEMSDYLYSNAEKGITAKSMSFSDIENLLIEGTKGDTVDTSTGKQKVIRYREKHVEDLSTLASSIKSKSGVTVTYDISHVIARKPKLYSYVSNKLEDKYFTASSFDSRALSMAGYVDINTRTVTYKESGAWNIGYGRNDYLDPKVYDVISWGQYGYLATRGISTNSYPVVDFGLYHIDYNNYISCGRLFDSAYSKSEYGNLVPLVTLTGNVKMVVSENGTNSNSPHEVVLSD